MDAKTSILFPLFVRSGQGKPSVMKKSRLLVDVIKDMDKPHFTAAQRRLSAKFLKDPNTWHEPVYAWLLINYDEVLKARTRPFQHVTWKGIAKIIEIDGVKGSRGDPPNANSVRRVWGRVCLNKKN